MSGYKYTTDIQLSTGSIILWSRRISKKVPVRCGDCKQERWLYNQNVTAERFTGLCLQCTQIASRTHTKTEILENGSIVYWNERQGIGRDQQIPVKCGICGEIRMIAASKIPNSSFTGYCVDCARTGERSHFWKGGRFKHPNGYIQIRLTPDHKFYGMADIHHLVPEHRLIMAEHIGRALRDNEIVHHKNGIKDDNIIENLELLDWRLHHKGYHAPELEGEPTTQEVLETFKNLLNSIFKPGRRTA